MPCGCSCGGRRWVAGPSAEVGISGLPVVLSPSAHWLRRLIWAIALATALFWLVLQVRLSVLRLQHQSVSTTARSSTQLELPFPAVTVCAGERLNVDRVLNLTQPGTTVEQWRSIKHMSRYKLIRWREFNFDEFFSQTSHNWSELVKSCEYQGDACESVGR
ncbi:hypothetical protein FJT64_012750 [Amphibalanus amphitrite]|uniref:Uncharacterized protein n=1 Tax=Amphibalanus amphitrite TaxID=1232801 RepID=A0A6A4VHK9_AMPAM|nr:hypothetical protein FJT64_012750 [Amphibalanus amphitrite]